MSDGWRTGLILGTLGLLAVSLILNIVALVRIGDLQNEIRGLRAGTGQTSSLSHDLRRIEKRLDELEVAEQWASEIEWDIGPDSIVGTCTDVMPITASWTLQEVTSDTDVHLELRRPGSGEWNRVSAEPLNTTEFRAATELSVSSQWEYRVVAESGGHARMTGPHQAEDLAPLTDRSLGLQRGESVNFGGEIWTRFAVYPTSERRTPCNEIEDATLRVYENDEVVESIPMDPEYPGQYPPETLDGTTDTSDYEDASVDTALPSGPEHEPWWTDWVQLTDGYNVEVVVEFVDGTEHTQQELGLN